MTAAIIPFVSPAKRRRERTVNGKRQITGFALALEARPGAVLFVTDEIELGLTPKQARDLALDLIEMADDAEAKT